MVDGWRALKFLWVTGNALAAVPVADSLRMTITSIMRLISHTPSENISSPFPYLQREPKVKRRKIEAEYGDLRRGPAVPRSLYLFRKPMAQVDGGHLNKFVSENTIKKNCNRTMTLARFMIQPLNECIWNRFVHFWVNRPCQLPICILAKHAIGLDKSQI